MNVIATWRHSKRKEIGDEGIHAERGLTPWSASTVGDLLEAWFELAAADFSPTTVKETRGFIDRSLLPAFGGRKLAKLNPSDVDAFYQQLRVSGSVDGQPLAPSTIRRIHGILRRALAQGVRWGWIGVNPAVASSPPRVPPTDISRAIVIGNHGLVEKDTKTHLSRRASTCGRSRGAWGIATLRPRSTSTPISSSRPIASQPT